MQGSAATPRLMSAAGGCMFTTSAGSDSRSGRRRAWNEKRRLVDGERRVFYAAMIILRPLEYDAAALEGVGIAGIGQEARAEIFGDDARLHDGGIEQVAAQHLEAGVALERGRVRADDVGVLRRRGGDVLAHGPPVDGERVGMDALAAASSCITAGRPPARK